MNLSEKDIEKLSRIAMLAADRAGNVIIDYTKNNKVVVENKLNNSKYNYSSAGTTLASQIITEVDHLSQNVIAKTIEASIKAYDLGLLTEESTDDLSRLEKDYFWCIDPLDGTLPFVESVAGYAVSIALVSSNGEPVIGVVFDPVKKILYHASKGRGVYRNNIPWKPDIHVNSHSDSYTFIIDRSFTHNPAYDNVLEELNEAVTEMGYNELNIIKHGGAAMNACWVLEKAPACYFKFPKSQAGGGSLWDYAATACIFQEVEASVSDMYNSPLDLNRKESTFLNHKGILYASDKKMAHRIIEMFSKITSC